MKTIPNSFVYHGSPREFDSELATPKRQVRQRMNNEGKYEVIFDEKSFHATPHKWIALAYTNTTKTYEIEGKKARYIMGVSLYENNKEIEIYGFESLEKSLEALYGDGGYIYHFDKDKFIYKEGLGNLEVIVQEPTKPISVERVDNPVEEMKKLGVTFHFTDLGLPENHIYRTYL
jgi:hypothetical protein